MPNEPTYLDLAAGVVSAFVGHNPVRPVELPDLIVAVHAAFAKLGAPSAVEEPTPELKPAVPVRKSITPDYLISLEDGRRFKALKRHLASRGMTPADYRAKWELPSDYPMVAPSYAATRSKLAMAAGLGRRPMAELVSYTALTPVLPEPATLSPVFEQDAAPPKRRGRPRKAM